MTNRSAEALEVIERGMNWSPWIDIAAGGHPPYNKRVLVVRAVQPMSHVLIAQRDWTDAKGEHYMVDGGAELSAEPTHWAPLLEVPKVEAPRPERKDR